MKVNKDKTEVVVFTKKGITKEQIEVAGTMIESKHCMKALGVMVDCNLRWQLHIESTVKKSAWKLSVLKRIRHLFSQKQYLQILTSQFFGALYYGSQVWLTSNTLRKLWKQIESIHYRAIRVAVNDHKRVINREKLDTLSSRASPRQWSKYALATVTLKTLREEKPVQLFCTVKETLYEKKRKPGLGRFFDNSRGKIGRQKFGNNLNFIDAITEPWLGMSLSDDQIRRLLKRTYFSYLK
jgi:hypothetical protein